MIAGDANFANLIVRGDVLDFHLLQAQFEHHILASSGHFVSPSNFLTRAVL